MEQGALQLILGVELMSQSFYEANCDLKFAIEELVDWNSFIPKFELDFKDAKAYQADQNANKEQALAPSNTQEAIDIYTEAFRQYGDLCTKEIAPISSKLDKEGLRFEKGKVHFPKEITKVIDIMASSGLLAFGIGREYGGLGLPITAQTMINELLAEADASFCVTLGCFNIADMLERFADDHTKEKYLKKITLGEYISAMALTEADYGSDLPHVQTKAVKTGSARVYEITGSKRYITHGCGVGDRPSLILTLARSSGSGAKGLSFFLVESKNIEVGGIEKKIGLHASPTCEIIYDKSKAILIGEEGKGLVKYAIGMMNGARLAVAVQSLGIANAAYKEAVKYASKRVQFAQTIEKIPAVKRLLSEINATNHAMRALIYQTSELIDKFESERKFMLDQGVSDREVRKNPDVKKLDKLTKLFTPVSKYFCSESANRVVYNATQVFGGAGFIEDYPIAQLYRDVRVTTIYEGTSQLQVVGAIGGIVEGMGEYSILNSFLDEKIDIIKDNELKNELNHFKMELSDLVELYKSKAKDLRDSLASDIVDYFCVFFSLLILTIHQQVAEAKKHSILDEKKRARKNFYLIARRVMEASKVQVSCS